MGMDLVGKGGEISFNWAGWRYVLDFGVEYGWKPDDKTDYFTNSGQRLKNEDAKNLSIALQKGLDEKGSEINPHFRGKVEDFANMCDKGGFTIY